MSPLVSPATERRLLARLNWLIDNEHRAPDLYGPRIVKISNILEI